MRPTTVHRALWPFCALAAVTCLSACSSLEGRRVSDPASPKASRDAGIPYFLSEPSFVVERRELKGGKEAGLDYAVEISSIPDPGEHYEVRLESGCFVSDEMNVTLGSDGRLSTMNAKSTDETGKTVVALAEVAAAAIGASSPAADKRTPAEMLEERSSQEAKQLGARLKDKNQEFENLKTQIKRRDSRLQELQSESAIDPPTTQQQQEIERERREIDEARRELEQAAEERNALLDRRERLQREKEQLEDLRTIEDYLLRGNPPSGGSTIDELIERTKSYLQERIRSTHQRAQFATRVYGRFVASGRSATDEQSSLAEKVIAAYGELDNWRQLQAWIAQYTSPPQPPPTSSKRIADHFKKLREAVEGALASYLETPTRETRAAFDASVRAYKKSIKLILDAETEVDDAFFASLPPDARSELVRRRKVLAAFLESVVPSDMPEGFGESYAELRKQLADIDQVLSSLFTPGKVEKKKTLPIATEATRRTPVSRVFALERGDQTLPQTVLLARALVEFGVEPAVVVYRPLPDEPRRDARVVAPCASNTSEEVKHAN